jgi:hypothetical protein
VFTLIRSITIRQLFTEQLPAFAVSFVIAELFYKFHSFALESLAFLATWFLIDLLISVGASMARHKLANKAKPLT